MNHDLDLNKQIAIDFYRTAYLGNPSKGYAGRSVERKFTMGRLVCLPFDCLWKISNRGSM